MHVVRKRRKGKNKSGSPGVCICVSWSSFGDKKFPFLLDHMHDVIIITLLPYKNRLWYRSQAQCTMTVMCHVLGLGHFALFSFMSHAICMILHDGRVYACVYRADTDLDAVDADVPSRAPERCLFVVTFIVQANLKYLTSYICNNKQT